MIMLFSRVSISLAVSVESYMDYVDLPTHRSNLSRLRCQILVGAITIRYPELATGKLLPHVQFPMRTSRVSTESAQAIRKCRGS